MTDFDPETSYGKIIRVNKYDPDEYETVGGLIQGRPAILEKLRELRQKETHKNKWGYIWKWVKRDPAGVKVGKKAKKRSRAEEADAEW